MRALIVLSLAAALTLAACGGTNLGLRGGVQVSFATRSAVPNPAAPFNAARMAALDDTLSDGLNELIVTSVSMVLREIKLRRVEASNCDVEPEPPGCEDVEFGPVLVDLPLDPGARQQYAIEVPAGTYVEIEFDIHKPDDADPTDLDFLARHPDYLGVSIRVQGTFNGTAYTYETDLNVKQELAFVPPLVVEETISTNVTVFVDIDEWYRDVQGTLVDPATANKGGVNENLVRDNIIRSIEAFEDRNRDGNPGD